MKKVITLFLLGFVLTAATAQTDSIAAYEKVLANAKDDTVKQYYHCKLYWECYLQPKKFVYHLIEAGIYQGNDWSRKEDFGNYAFFWDSLTGIKRELNAAKEVFKSKGDMFREARTLIALSVFEEDNIQKAKYLQDALGIIQQQKDSRLKSIFLDYLKIDLLINNKNGNDPHLGITEIFALINEFKQKNNLLYANNLLGLLGANYNQLNQIDSAKYYSEQYFQYQIKIGARKENYLPIAAQLMLNCGQLKQYDLCKYYSKFIETRIDSVSKFKTLSTYLSLNLALYYMNVEVSGKELSKDKSKEYLDKAKVFIDNYTSSSSIKFGLLQQYYTYYTEWAKIFGDYKTAYEKLQTFFVLYDSSLSASNVKAFGEMQIKYEVAQKDKDLLLAQQKTKLQTTWFVVVVLVLLVIAFGVFYYQKNRNKINQLEQMLKVRNTIAANLHDEVGSTLGSVAIMSRIAQGKDQDEKNSMLSTISGNAQNMLDSMRDIVWSINPENDKLENLLSRMKIFAAETLEKQDIEVVFNVDAKQQGIVIPIEKRKDIYLIYKEAIINAAKYSKAKNVNVEITESNKKLTISVKDDGIGFINNSAESLGGNGLKNIQKRAEHIGGTIEINSAEQRGTTISLTVTL